MSEARLIPSDRARLRRVIERLKAEGFYYANTCCDPCGFADAVAAGAENILNINDQAVGGAFYGDHGRVPANRLPAMMVGPLYVAYNGHVQRIVDVFKEEGFVVEWDGNWAKKICVRSGMTPGRPATPRLERRDADD